MLAVIQNWIFLWYFDNTTVRNRGTWHKWIEKELYILKYIKNLKEGIDGNRCLAKFYLHRILELLMTEDL